MFGSYVWFGMVSLASMFVRFKLCSAGRVCSALMFCSANIARHDWFDIYGCPALPWFGTVRSAKLTFGKAIVRPNSLSVETTLSILQRSALLPYSFFHLVRHRKIMPNYNVSPKQHKPYEVIIPHHSSLPQVARPWEYPNQGLDHPPA